MLNLDALRFRAIGDNGTTTQINGFPATDNRSMTVRDVGYVSDRVTSLAPDAAPDPLDPRGKMQFTPLVQLAHSTLATEDGLLAFLTEHAERARKMLRPAYGSFDMLPPSIAADAIPSGGHRDPRINRDPQHDMRMPPYMRDETATALSLSRRQYVEVLALIDALAERTASKSNPLVAVADTLTEPDQSNLRKRVRAVLAQINTRRAPGAS